MKFQIGDVIIWKYDNSKFAVLGIDGPYYRLKFLSSETHYTCLLRQEGHAITYVDENCRGLTPLEKVLK